MFQPVLVLHCPDDRQLQLRYVAQLQQLHRQLSRRQLFPALGNVDTGARQSASFRTGRGTRKISEHRDSPNNQRGTEDGLQMLTE